MKANVKSVMDAAKNLNSAEDIKFTKEEATQVISLYQYMITMLIQFKQNPNMIDATLEALQEAITKVQNGIEENNKKEENNV